MNRESFIDEFGEVTYDSVMIVSSGVARRFHPWVERDDITSELYLYAWKHRKSLGRMIDPEDETASIKQVSKALSRAAIKYARSAKAQRLGYSVSDEFFYDAELIADLIFAIGNEGTRPNFDELERRTGTPLGEYGNWDAMIIDAKRALDTLDPMDRGIVLAKFADQRASSDIAKDWDITRQSIDERVQRSLIKMRNVLGGSI